MADWIAGPEETYVVRDWRGRDGRMRSADTARHGAAGDRVRQRLGDMLLIQHHLRSTAAPTRASGARHRTRHCCGTHPPDGIVLDLRGNRGGLLRRRCQRRTMLLPPGIVATTAGRDPRPTRIWRSDYGRAGRRTCRWSCWWTAAPPAPRRSWPPRWPIAGARVVVGSSTLGKGLVQTIAPLPDGGELFVTWSRVLAPRGWPIQGLGVLPQVCTSLGQDALQLAACECWRRASSRWRRRSAIERAARAPLPPAQVLAIRSACPAAEGRDSDLDGARLLIQHPAAYAAALLPAFRDSGQLSVVSGQNAGR